MKNEYFIIMQVCLSAVIYGFIAISIKFLTGYASPLTIATLRIFIGFLFLFLYVHFKKQHTKPDKATWKLIIISGISSVFLHHILLVYGIKHASPTTGAIITGMTPLTTLILSILLLREKTSLRKKFSILLGTFAVCLIIFSKNETSMSSFSKYGEFLILSAAFMYSYGAIIIKRIPSSISIVTFTCYSHAIGACLFIFTIPFNDNLSEVIYAPASFWIVLLFTAIGVTGVATILWYKGVQHLGPSTASLFLNINPIVGVIASSIIFKETLNFYQLLGFVIVLFSLVVGLGGFKTRIFTSQHNNPKKS